MASEPALPAEWSAATRFLECDAREAAWAERLRAAGLENYVALAAPEALPGLRARLGGWAAKVAPWTDPGQAERNDAEVLILSHDAARLVATRRSFSRAREVLVPEGAGGPGARLALLVRRLVRNLRPLGRVTLRSDDGAPRAYRRLAAPYARKRRPRRYLSPELGLARFFEELNRRGLRYVVLRWFEDLPERAPDGDVDMLVHDDDVPALEEVLGGRTGTIPLDLYTVYGAHDGPFRGACYFPSPVSERMLARATTNAHGVKVPAPRDAFLGLAYHALYHKGERSGLPTGTPGVRPIERPDHDFPRLLREGAERLGLGEALGEPTMESLDRLLEREGWKPPRDTLRKWARRNPWLARRFFRRAGRAEPPGPAVFVVRRRALEKGLLPRVEEEIERHGFELLATRVLEPRAAQDLAVRTRGGNWGRGDFPADGGPPAALVLAHDPRPKRLRRRYRRRYPDMDNGRIVCKRAIRDTINAELPEAERANFLHTSDNAEEAWEYVRHALPDELDELRALAARARAGKGG